MSKRGFSRFPALDALWPGKGGRGGGCLKAGRGKKRPSPKAGKATGQERRKTQSAAYRSSLK